MDEKQNDKVIAALIDFLSKRQKEKNDFRNKSSCCTAEKQRKHTNRKEMRR